MPVRDNTAPSIIIPAVGLNVLLLVALRTYTRFVVTASETGLDDWVVLLLAVCDGGGMFSSTRLRFQSVS